MRRILLVAAVLAPMFVVGFVLLRAGGSSAPPAAAIAASDPVEGTTSIGIPVPSPADAAARAVAMTGDVVRAGLISRRDLIGSFTTVDFGDDLAQTTSAQIASMHLALVESGDPTEMSVVEFPLRTHTTDRSPTRATVEVWSVIVVSRPVDAVARQTWRTVTVELEVVDGRWLVDGWESAEGPTPAGTPEGVIGAAGDVAGRLAWDAVSSEAR